MKRIVSWKSTINNRTLENCRIRKIENGYLIESVTTGIIDDFPAYCAYKIRTNPNWETQEFTVYVWMGWEEHTISMRKTAIHWEADGKPTDRFANCVDLDISITPFTNSLPINRLSLEIGASQEIEVVYINVAKLTAEPVRQRYTRLSGSSYLYENVDNGFEAEITIDDDGIVVEYPELFSRI